MSRLEKWKEPRRLLTVTTGDNAELTDAIFNAQKDAPVDEKPTMSSDGIVRASKEIIFDVENGKPTFHYIMYSVNSKTGELEVGHLLSSFNDDKDTEDEVEGEIMGLLAMAAMEEVPVYPNHDGLCAELASYHRRMLVDGFPVTTGGVKTWYRLTKSPGSKIDNPRYIEEFVPTRHYSPIEISLIKEAVVKELKRLESTERLLSSLRSAIDGLKGMLETSNRNENELQKHLTENPLLFGLEYSQVIPKHRLGSEYEMDYALEKHSGFYDIVEIEASSLNLYTKGGNPSSYLVHAEQQVLDWLDWIERHYSYAVENLPGLINPKGYVIIGLRSSLSESDAKKLKRRNAVYNGKLQIYTYEDLLDRATNILSQLEAFKA